MKSDRRVLIAAGALLLGCSSSDTSDIPIDEGGTDAQSRADGPRGPGPTDGLDGAPTPSGNDARTTNDAPGVIDDGATADTSRTGDSSPARDASDGGLGTDASGVRDAGVGNDGRGGADAPLGSDARGGTDAAGTDASLPRDAQVDVSQGVLGIGAHAVVNDRQAQGSSPMTTPPVNTQTSGSTFVLFVAYLATQGTVSDNMGNTYAQVGVWQTYANSGGFFSAYVCVGCAGGAGHTFSFNKPTFSGAPQAEASLFAVEVLGSPSVDAFVQAASLTNPIDAGSVTTTHAGDVLLIAALGNSYGEPDTYTPSPGYTLLDQQTNGGDSMAGGDAFQIAGAPGAYGGTLTSSLTMDPTAGSAIFLIALGR
jgi:hypothetical protein